jgi:endonuclease-3 related protein
MGRMEEGLPQGLWRWERAGRPELMGLYRVLYAAFGPQGWWPGKTPFEVMTGAILTQNTNWRNVEKAIANLRAARLLTPGAMRGATPGHLAGLIRPAGSYRVKAGRLRNLLDHLAARHGGSVARMLRTPAAALREELLAVKGVGPETADSILLYAAGRPAFVVDAYTRRICSRHGLVDPAIPYDGLQQLFTRALPADPRLFNEYHALLVRLGKEYCRPRGPRCADCPLGAPPEPSVRRP